MMIELRSVEDEQQQNEMFARVVQSDVYQTLNQIFSDVVGGDIEDCKNTLYLESPEGLQMLRFETQKKEVQYAVAFKLNEENVFGDMEISPNDAQHAES